MAGPEMAAETPHALPPKGSRRARSADARPLRDLPRSAVSVAAMSTCTGG